MCSYLSPGRLVHSQRVRWPVLEPPVKPATPRIVLTSVEENARLTSSSCHDHRPEIVCTHARLCSASSEPSGSSTGPPLPPPPEC